MPRDMLNGKKIIRVEYNWIRDPETNNQRKYVSFVVLDSGQRLRLSLLTEPR